MPEDGSNCTLAVLVDQLSLAKEYSGKAGAKYFEGKLCVTFEPKLLSD